MGLVLACAFLWAGFPAPARGADPRVRKCAKRLAKGLQRFTKSYVETLADCHTGNLDEDPDVDCSIDEDVQDEIAKTTEKLRREARKCDESALRAICPLGARDFDELVAAVTGGPGTVADGLEQTLEGIYVSSHAPSCPRPEPEVGVSRPAQDCGERIARAVREAADDLDKCFFSCALDELKHRGDDPCVDDATGYPIREKLSGCVDRVFDGLADQITSRCDTDDLIVELGCPMGAATVQGATALLWSSLYANVRAANLGLYHSPCASAIGQGADSGDPLPAAVLLLPSGTQKEVRCGDALDASFFAADTTARFLQDLDCSPLRTPSDGIVVAASGVTIDGDARKRRIIGPGGSANRTGTGILLAPGATGVTVKDFRSIEFFGVGIGDAGDNAGLRIDRLSVRRNRTAGVRATTPGVVIQDVKADRNTVGFDLWGDGTVLKRSSARRSAPMPGYGVYLHGVDMDGSGVAIRVNQCDVEDNLVGVVAEGSGHVVEESELRGNALEAIVFGADGGVIDDNSIKLNGADGVVIQGDGNTVTANRSDENAGNGFVVTGSGNRLDGNGAGTLTDRGNSGAGYVISGVANELTSNRAEANAGSGFVLTAAQARFASNDAKGNAGVGFDVQAGGTGLDTNVAEANGGLEFRIAPGNVDESGNRANGSTFTFDASGGEFE